MCSTTGIFKVESLPSIWELKMSFNVNEGTTGRDSEIIMFLVSSKRIRSLYNGNWYPIARLIANISIFPLTKFKGTIFLATLFFQFYTVGSRIYLAIKFKMSILFVNASFCFSIISIFSLIFKISLYRSFDYLVRSSLYVKIIPADLMSSHSMSLGSSSLCFFKKSAFDLR